MPLWHKDDLELRASEKKQRQEELSGLPHLPKNRARISLVHASLLFDSRKRRTLVTKDGHDIEVTSYKLYLPLGPPIYFLVTYPQFISS